MIANHIPENSTVACGRELSFGRQLKYASKRMTRSGELLFLISFFAISTPSAPATPAHLQIDHTDDPVYLPLKVEPVPIGEYDGFRSLPPARVKVFQVKRSENGQAVFTVGYLPEVDQDAPSSVVFFDATSGTVQRELTLYGSYADHCTYFDPSIEEDVLVRLSSWRDSCFLVRQFLERPGRDTLFISHGTDHTGDGAWRGDGTFEPIADIDADGLPELYIFASPGRDREPRFLVSVDLVGFRLNWKLPLASLKSSFVPIVSESDPAICMTTYGPSNGSSDSVFSDEFGYFTKVSKDGKIAWNAVVSANFTKPLLARLSENADLGVLYHTLPLLGVHDKIEEPYKLVPTLSIVDLTSGKARKSVSLREQIASLNLVELGVGDPQRIVTVSYEGVVSVYTQQLELLAVSEPTPLLGLVDTLRINDSGPPALAFERRGGLSLYSSRFDQLATIAALPTPAIYPLRYSGGGHVTEFVTEKGLIASITTRPLKEYLTVWFWRSRIYVLSLLSATIVALIFTNIYRKRARRDMLIIARQKEDLERAHEDLKVAQERIVEQEKYRQAQEIAGGFAHEMRNSLFPALAGLHRLSEAVSIQNKEVDWKAILGRIESAVVRTLKLVDVILEYTRIGSQVSFQVCDLREYVERATLECADVMERDKIHYSFSAIGESRVYAPSEYLETVLRNVIVNAHQAMESVPVRELKIELQEVTGVVYMKISDTGCGMTKEQQGRVFDVFYSTKPAKGSGLGLSIVKRLMSVMGGQVEVSSESGRGTIMTLSWPSVNNKSEGRAE